jgi:GNAT superfamily N-acetyltransferase
MCDEWMPTLCLPLTKEQFHELPRNAAYKYELISGKVYLTPRPKHYHAVLELPILPQDDAPKPVESVTLRRLERTDLAQLERVFSGAFRSIQPFGSLGDEQRLLAAQQCLHRTCTGGDGPWVESASLVAVDPAQDWLIGAIFITLLPQGDPCDWDSYYWREPPPEGFVERREGRAHLTWIFVSPLYTGYGTGTALLQAAAAEVVALGYRQLYSTFLLGNESSMLWHWRNGFQLLSYPGSKRRWRLWKA